jgi:hypothetical protein
MIYPVSLQLIGILVGIVLVAAHVAALAVPGPTQSFLRALPRSRAWGTTLLVVGAVWSFWLVRTMDLGEFQPLRSALTIAVPVGAVLAWLFVDEFLSVRSLGILALLAAEPLLEAAYLRPEVSRLLLVCLAYVWIVAGLFLVGMPYVLRDVIAWLLLEPRRYRSAAAAGVATGVAILVCAVALW